MLNKNLNINKRLKVAIAAIVPCLILLFSIRNGMKFHPDNIHQELILYCSRLANMVIGGGITLLIINKSERLINYGIVRSDHIFLVLFLLFTGWFGFWLYGQWPGFLTTDSYAVIAQVYSLHFDDWYSYLHPMIHLMLFQLLDNPVVIPIFQVLLSSFVFAWIFTELTKLGASLKLIAIFALLYMFSIPVIVNTLYYTRDTIFGIIHLGLAFYIYTRKVQGKNEIPRLHFLFLIIIVCFLSIYRGDGIFLIGVIPIILLWMRTISWRRSLILIIVLVIGVGALKTVVPSVFGVQENPREYGLTLIMNPLGYILQHDFYSANKENDIKTIGKVLNVPQVKELSHPYEIPAYYAGAYWDSKASKQEFEELHHVYYKIVKDNLPLFIADRILTFSAATGLSSQGHLYSDDARSKKLALEEWNTIQQSPSFHTLAPRLFKVQSDLINKTTPYEGGGISGRFLFWNFLPMLVICLIALVLYPYIPATAFASIIILYRVPIVFLTAPASQFKYYYSLYLFGILVILLGITEYKLAKMRKRNF